MVIFHLRFISGLCFRSIPLHNGILQVCGPNPRIPWEIALHWENHHLSCACENFTVLNCRWHCSWTRWKCGSNILVHPCVPQKHSSSASTTYNTQKRTRSGVTMDWDGISTAHLFIYTQLLASHGSASTLRCRVSLHFKRINKCITQNTYVERWHKKQSTKY